MAVWILKVIGIVLLVSILCYLRSVQAFLKRPQKSEERVFFEGHTVAREAQAGIQPSKKALLLYQDSRHGTFGKMAEAAAKKISEEGYLVVVNHPSDKLEYDPMEYDLLVFGSPAYLGQMSGLLAEFIKNNPFTHKTVFIFSAGITPEDRREMERILDIVPKRNHVVSVKVCKGAEDELKDFLEREVLCE